MKESSFVEHFSELRRRLVYSILVLLVAFIGCYLYAEELYGFLVSPLADIYATQDGTHNSRRLIYTGLTEVFFTYIKVSFYSALFISFPFIAWQGYIFLAPGLYKHEKIVLLPYLILAPLLFITGAALVYYCIFPLAWQFFLGFEIGTQHTNTLPIQLEARVSEYLSLVIHLIFAFGLAFQLPIILTLLARIGVISPEALKKKRKYALLAIVTVAAIITPPDIISQIGLALPLLLLYEISIIACKWSYTPQQDNE